MKTKTNTLQNLDEIIHSFYTVISVSGEKSVSTESGSSYPLAWHERPRITLERHGPFGLSLTYPLADSLTELDLSFLCR